jgi:hypothetical protein
MRKTQFPMHLVILTLMSLLMMAHLHYRTSSFPFWEDSEEYIEQARNLVNFGSALSTPSGLIPADKDQIENNLFPIGFPIVIATVSSFGFDAKDVAVELVQLSAIVLPWLLYFCFCNALGSVCSLVLTALSLTSLGILTISLIAYSDVFSLAIVVGAIGLILNSRSTWGFILGGILAGMAYSVRNAHLALLVTIVLYFCYLWLVRKGDERLQVYKQAASCIAGMLIILIPLLTRNVIVFGSLNPYQMDPSTVGFIENLKTYIEALLEDLTDCRPCAKYIAWSTPGLLLFSIVVICLCWLFSHYVWRNLEDAKKNAIMISIIYIIAGSCIVIAARTRYQWGEPINVRHTLQYTPFLLGIFLAAVIGQSRQLSKIRWLFVTILTFFHVNIALFSGLTQRDSSDPFLLNAYKTGANHLCQSAKDDFLVSNWAYVFRIECGARVRGIVPVNFAHPENELKLIADNKGYSSLMDVIVDIKNKSMGRPIRIGFFPGNYGLESSDFPLSDIDQQTLLHSGWTIVRNDERGLLLQRLKDST